MENINSVVEGPLDQIGKITGKGKLKLKNVRLGVTYKVCNKCWKL